MGEITAKRRPPVVVLTIDCKVHPAGTSLVVDARGLTAENLGKLKAKMPNMVVILLASPPCIAYSTVNTTGVRELELADDLVRVVQAFHETLGPVCTIMENPAAPGLLSEREVSQFLRTECKVNYCAHGGMFKKPTQLWTGPEAFFLTANGFRRGDVQVQGSAPSCCCVVETTSGNIPSGRAHPWRSGRPSHPNYPEA